MPWLEPKQIQMSDISNKKNSTKFEQRIVAATKTSNDFGHSMTNMLSGIFQFWIYFKVDYECNPSNWWAIHSN